MTQFMKTCHRNSNVIFKGVYFLCIVFVIQNVILSKQTTAKQPPHDLPISEKDGDCASNQFKCTEDGLCIPAHWKCDSRADCSDASDEPPECQLWEKCRSGQFQCKLTRKCIPHGWTCDGDLDCGLSEEFGIDTSDENVAECSKPALCPANEARCGDTMECRPIRMFCDGNRDCPDNSDEWDFCINSTACANKQCEVGCKPTGEQAQCFCADGQQPENEKCIDADECLIHGSCDQLCTNTIGSYKCSCVPGYTQNGKYCRAVNVPPSERVSLLFSTQSDVRRTTIDGTPWQGNSSINALNTHALDFSHKNRTVCYVQNNLTKSALVCANVSNFAQQWVLPRPPVFSELDSIHQIALDWISGNWYFLDNSREAIFVCNSTLQSCIIILELNLSKPRVMALDPTKGFIFFTKWGNSPPMLERALLDGTNRTTLVERKIIYPYGVTLDFPTQHIYWVDKYLNFIERVNYDGSNRLTIKKGVPVQNLYSVSVFENLLFVASWRSNNIVVIDKYKAYNHLMVGNISMPFNIQVFHRQRQPEAAHPCKSNNGNCDHICISAWKKDIAVAQCLCQPGYQLKGHGRCIATKLSTFLLYGKGRPGMIKGIELTLKPKREDIFVRMIISNLKRPMAVDYDSSTQYVYYSDVQRYVIERQKISTDIRETVIEDEIHNCEGIAIDWMGKNIYWTDEGLSQINVARLANITQRKTLIHGSMFHPRAIVLNPKYGYMYWSDWAPSINQTGKIERSWMDGTHWENFINSSLHWPNGLTIDYVNKVLYWCDARLDKIESINLDGTNRKTVYEGSNLDHPFGLVYFNNTLYWTEFQKGTIQSLYLPNKTYSTVITENAPLFEIRVYDNKTQQGINKCSVNNGGCSELCLITPSGATCACKNGYTYENGICSKEKNYTVPSRCQPGYFQCKKNLKCIDKRYICDGDEDCGDGSDEDLSPGGVCENVVCRQEQFRCDGIRCISAKWVCDGDEDCLDGTDENVAQCMNSTCSPQQFTCKITGRCIPLTWTCDLDLDCGENDTSDEHDNCKYNKCPEIEFECDNKHCVPQTFHCDGENDCRDGSDEKDCLEYCNPATNFYCAADETCLTIMTKCDGTIDCSDGSDETNCTTSKEVIISNSSHRYPLESKCAKYEFLCGDKQKCIRMIFLCDGYNDCTDNSDEANCTKIKVTRPNVTLTTTVAPSLECEHPSRLCDKNSKCITVDQLCDGHSDCEDGSDEGLRCSESLCDHSVDCSHNCHSAPEGLVCWCPQHLYLHSDGMTCLRSHPCDTWGACSQTCTPLKNRRKCGCFDGYQLHDDGFTCKSLDSTTPYVIFSNRHELRSVDLHTYNMKALISSLKNTIALDFYYNGNTTMVFWTDVIDDKIYRGTLIGGILSTIEAVVQTGLSTAEGLAVDWIGQNLYWVESNLDQIEVARLNGSFRRTLVAGDIESPRAIALDPRDGLLFWTDWDATLPRIERCSMAGHDRIVVVKVDKLTAGAWPNGLTLDYASRRIYWIDARSDTIHTTKYDGTDLHEVIRDHETLSHPFAITLYENYVYWTDWRSNSVFRANKWNGSDISVIQRTLTQPFDIHILHPSRQPKDVPNPCGNNNGGCSHLCLLNGNGTYKCDCPHVMKLEKDEKTCVVNERVLLFSRASEIRGVDLSQPYYHTIPTISLQVLSPSQLDFVAKTSTLYWTDPQLNEVKRSGLTSGPTQVIIDTGIENPTGLAIDWISDIMFISSSGDRNEILACNLAGEFSTVIHSGKDLLNIESLAVDPTRGKLYWSHGKTNVNGSVVEGKYLVEVSNMDGSSRKVLHEKKTYIESQEIQSLTMDLESWRLYWITTESTSIEYFDFVMKRVEKIQLGKNAQPVALVVYNGLVYYANNQDSAIHMVNKTTGKDDIILRNGTGNIVSLRIYDANIQKGNNSCGFKKGGCHHLCLPLSATEHSCRCATGYFPDPADSKKCKGHEIFIFYSVNWEIRGITLKGDNSTNVLGPISKVHQASNIDYYAEQDYIYWADSDRGTVTRIKRDGTERQVVVEQSEMMESSPIDWLTGLAVDWIAGNIYWSDPKHNVIEVAKLNGSSKYVVISLDIDKPTSIALDPEAGYLIWAGAGSIECARLDGSNHVVLLNQSASITDITLDRKEKKIYWADTSANRIERMNYDGSDRELLLDHSLDNPQALILFEETLFWIDTVHEKGSIKSGPISNLSNYDLLLSNLGDSLKDIKIFSKKLQKGYNACGINNGGCEELCLFNGTHPVCACPHGNVAKDGKSCEEYKSFIMYSRVVRIDSIHMFDSKNRNAPYPSIADRDLIRNTIGLSYDYARSKLFYSDIQRGSINSVYFNGSDNTIIVDKQGSVEGLAFERINNVLYWTCNNDATIHRINLTEKNVRLNNSMVEKVVQLGSNDKPRGIAVDSCDMRIYWTNWNSHQPSIQRAYITSFQRESIITKDIRMPNGITLDHKAQKLYWTDARLDKIERCDYDGSNRFVIIEKTPQHPFDIAVYGDYLYWTDWVNHAVIRVNKYTADELVWLRGDVPRPMGIVAIAEDEDNCETHLCKILNGGCEDICSLDEKANVVCSCSEGRVLADEGKRCVAQITKMECNSEAFRCSDGGCIPFQLTCDGIPHCADNSDENPSYCVWRECRPGYFECQNKRCISYNLTCNSVDNCGDNSDELSCPCSDDIHFRCHSDGKCIAKEFKCDHDPDCNDASDEFGCQPKNCVLYHNNTNMINCKQTTTGCIHKDWVCDGEQDCWDNSDEQNCTNKTTPISGTVVSICTSDQFACRHGLCIPKSWRCDGDNDCFDIKEGEKSSDEENCDLCQSNQFRCKNGDCIPISYLCDGTPDCDDWSDENDHCKNHQCASDQFRCNSTGRCIPKTWICDGDSDCKDNADEELEECRTSKRGSFCLHTQFQCLNGACIAKQFICDHYDDCGDNSDEPPFCSAKCLDTEFTCSNSKCIIELWKCNGKDDCGDKSDEDPVMCATHKNFSCKESGLFECENSECVNSTLLCNGEDDCGDFSDERSCNINECIDPTICKNHQCIDKPVGYICECSFGYKNNETNPHICEDIDECQERPCSQICKNNIGSYTCSCIEGYKLNKHDNYSCKAASDIQATLIYSNRYYIRELDFTGKKTILAHNLTNAVALDFDWKDQYIYWSDVTTLGSSIKRMKIDKTSQNQTHEILHSATLLNPDGLAVDWVGRNLYWCDKGLDTIEVSTLNGKYRKVLINKGLEEPRAITLDPDHGYMYWSDWGSNAHIGKCGMDGSNQRIIISENIGWPNGLTVSYETNELFWADAREDYIAVSDLEGKNIKIIVSRAQNPSVNLHHVFAIAIWEDFIYYTDWETKTIEKCHKYRGNKCTSLTTILHRPMDVQVFHPFRQRPTLHNACANHNCSTLCLLTPEPPFYKCACPENYILDPQDGVSCKSNCTSSHFVCEKTYKCIPFWWKCDTQDDCGDGSDEPSTCPPFQCMPGQFQCNNTNCIHPSQLCNGEKDCDDGSDEQDCNNYTCLNAHFKCKGNATHSDFCILATKYCDGQVNCPGGEDELNCPRRTCLTHHFMCDSGKCIPSVWVCDGDDDCEDHSDEKHDCDKRECPADHYRCKRGRCIPKTWLCDGDIDCVDRDDESSSCNISELHTCEPTYFQCANNKCIPGRWRCDYYDDCGDGSDEVECVPRNCSESEFRCHDNRCIRGMHQCDGEYNCDDHSDELNCNVTCDANEFQCSNPRYCIFAEWTCDGDTDCADGTDELNCNEACSENRFTCANKQCIWLSWRCDGENDCHDGSDELPELCMKHSCDSDRFRCANNKCIPQREVCDGHDQCGDNSDETHESCWVSVLTGRKSCLKDGFLCDNKDCVANELRCDGKNDCGDNSDEVNCTKQVCQWNTCSQICTEKKHNNFTCSCSEGYILQSITGGKTCAAIGQPATLMVASEAELRFLSPYKAGEESPNHLLDKTATVHGFKVDNFDVLYDPRGSTVFYSDRQKKKVQSLRLKTDNSNPHRNKRDTEQMIPVLTLVEPRGVAVNWVNQLLYIIDSDNENSPHILVSTLDGTYKTILVEKHLTRPRDIVVDPSSGVMVWTDWGPEPRIEIAGLDGSNRRKLVESYIEWPTSISIDRIKGRLYWADPKARVVESILLNGEDRHTVRHFAEDIKPYKLDVFEDTIYLTTLHTHNIMKLDKFNRSEPKYLVQGLPRLSNILILQEQKQPKITTICNSTVCQPPAFCLQSNHKNYTCKCPVGYIMVQSNTKSSCKLDTNKTESCPLDCHVGTCKQTAVGPKCICPPLYEGARCEQYRCSQFCRNKGMCYADHLSQKPSADSPPPLKCNCPPQWTGDRCETPVRFCDHCYNGGTCLMLPGLLACKCLPGYTGIQCENCINLTCQNRGICFKNTNGSDSCHCRQGYNGPKCEISHCENYCKNNGTCSITSNGPQCTCPIGFVGKKCELDACRDHCKNGGSCIKTSKQITCECPPLFDGRRCEKDTCAIEPFTKGCENRTELCPNSPCLHNGICEIIRGEHLCQCIEPWEGGLHCETYIGYESPCKNYCENNAICTVLTVTSRPRCTCRPGWVGDKCSERPTCKNYCLNGGTCDEIEIGDVVCTCFPNYHGMRCEFYDNDDISSTIPDDVKSRANISEENSTGHLFVGLTIAVGVLIIIFAILLGGFLILRKRRSGKPFMHARLQDNVEISNPMYLNEDLDDDGDDPLERSFTLDSDKGGNFANPVYDSMYNNTDEGHGSEEKTVLLQNLAEEIPVTESENI